jgi:hypothetical protein
MSGATRLVHVGTYLRLEFCDGRSIAWAVPHHPPGTGDDPARAYAQRYQERLARLAAVLEPLLVGIAAGAGGSLLACDHPGFAARRQVIDLGPVIGGLATLTLEVALPGSLEEAARERLHAAVAGAWNGRPRRSPGSVPGRGDPRR